MGPALPHTAFRSGQEIGHTPVQYKTFNEARPLPLHQPTLGTSCQVTHLGSHSASGVVEPDWEAVPVPSEHGSFQDRILVGLWWADPGTPAVPPRSRRAPTSDPILLAASPRHGCPFKHIEERLNVIVGGELRQDIVRHPWWCRSPDRDAQFGYGRLECLLRLQYGCDGSLHHAWLDQVEIINGLGFFCAAPTHCMRVRGSGCPHSPLYVAPCPTTWGQCGHGEQCTRRKTEGSPE